MRLQPLAIPLACIPLACIAMTVPANAQWENLNPGAGGRIQEITLDPNTPGRAYYMSDMEGASRTDDYGMSWKFLGRDMAYPNTLSAAVEPGNANRVYLGSLGGLEISDDAGETWRRVSSIDDPISTVAVNPQKPDEIFALPGNKMRWQHAPIRHEPSPFGRRVIYISRDRGQSFEEVAFNPGQGRRDTLTISFHKTDPKRMVLAALAGVFQSSDGGRTWTMLPNPADTGDAWGADLSPDGKVLYAAFQVAEGGDRIRRTTGMNQPPRVPTRLYATPLDEINWQPVTGLPDAVAGGQDGDVKQFWNPVVDPSSTPGQHRVLISSIGDRSGLWEITADWKKGKLVGSEWNRIFYYANNGKGADFDHGWEQYSTRPLSWQYTPKSWGEDGIWTTGDQTLFRARRDGKNWEQSWTPLYTEFVKEIDGKRFYTTRGVQCTFVFEGTGEGKYVVQANADNAIKESYDGGKSWTVGIVKPRSNAVTIVRTAKPMIVLAHISPGYGAASAAGTLWVKRLEHISPRDEWREIAGGPAQVGGLPNTLYQHIITDPHDPKRVFIGTIDKGLYVIDDIEAFVDSSGQKSKARRITDEGNADSPTMVTDKNQGMAIDPNTPGRMWVVSDKGFFRGDEQTGGTWQWQTLRPGVSKMAMWDNAGHTMLATVTTADDGNEQLEFSSDLGQTWPHTVSFTEHFRPLRDPSWYRPEDYTMRAMSPIGHGDTVYVAFGDQTKNRPFGYFALTLDNDGALKDARDITRDMPFPEPVEARIIDDASPDGPALYVGTWGNGLWRLRLDRLQ